MVKSANEDKAAALKTVSKKAEELKVASKRVVDSFSVAGKMSLESIKKSPVYVAPKTSTISRVLVSSNEAYIIADKDATSARIAAEKAEKALVSAKANLAHASKVVEEIKVKKKIPAFAKVYDDFAIFSKLF